MSYVNIFRTDSIIIPGIDVNIRPLYPSTYVLFSASFLSPLSTIFILTSTFSANVYHPRVFTWKQSIYLYGKNFSARTVCKCVLSYPLPKCQHQTILASTSSFRPKIRTPRVTPGLQQRCPQYLFTHVHKILHKNLRFIQNRGKFA